MIEGEDFNEPQSSDPSALGLDLEQLEPLEDSQAEIYEKAFRVFQDARQNLEALLIAGGFGNKDIVRAVLQGDNKHFVTRPSKNGDSI